jgi:hypothetical protein
MERVGLLYSATYWIPYLVKQTVDENRLVAVKP